VNDLDAKIRAALAQEDAALLEHFGGEPSLQEQMIETFRGRQRWLVAMGFAMTLIALALLVWCGIQFFHAESTRSMIAWATGFIWALIFIAMTKIWYWGELNRNALLREVKRLELQVANLSRRLAEVKA
jgi:hypothetical protein